MTSSKNNNKKTSAVLLCAKLQRRPEPCCSLEEGLHVKYHPSPKAPRLALFTPPLIRGEERKSVAFGTAVVNVPLGEEEQRSYFVLMHLLHAWQNKTRTVISVCLSIIKIVGSTESTGQGRGLLLEEPKLIGWKQRQLWALPSLAQTPLSPLSLVHPVDRWQISVCVPPFLFSTEPHWARSLSHFPPRHLFPLRVPLPHIPSVASSDWNHI